MHPCHLSNSSFAKQCISYHLSSRLLAADLIPSSRILQTNPKHTDSNQRNNHFTSQVKQPSPSPQRAQPANFPQRITSRSLHLPSTTNTSITRDGRNSPLLQLRPCDTKRAHERLPRRRPRYIVGGIGSPPRRHNWTDSAPLWSWQC